jgi:hypothetical protein
MSDSCIYPPILDNFGSVHRDLFDCMLFCCQIGFYNIRMYDQHTLDPGNGNFYVDFDQSPLIHVPYSIHSHYIRGVY